MDWDTLYEDGSYLKAWDCAHPSQELVATVAALGIPFGGAALDIGCGAGREAIFLAEIGFAVIGVDMSAQALQIAEKRSKACGAKVDWRKGNALALPIVDGGVSFVNDRGCFHHLGEADRPRYAEEIGRVLRPGGHLLLRGCRQEDSKTFVPVTAERLDRVFSPKRFMRGPVLPIQLQSDGGMLDAHVVLIRRL